MENANGMRNSACASGNAITSEAMIARIQEGNSEATAQFVLSYQSVVRAVSMDVLQNERAATMATRATFKNAILQLQNGVRTGQIEPWLLWIARNEALALTQIPSMNATATKPAAEQTVAYVSAQEGAASEKVRQPLYWKTPTKQTEAAPTQREREQAHDSPSRKSSGTAANVLIIILIVLVALALVWLVMGLLANNGIVSLPDLGFSWFSSHLFPLF